jgi:hypothetical protein
MIPPPPVEIQAPAQGVVTWVSPAPLRAGREIKLRSIRVNGNPLVFGNLELGAAYMYGRGVVVRVKDPPGKHWRVRVASARNSTARITIRYRIGKRHPSYR